MVAWLTIDKILAVTTFHFFFADVVVKISRFRLAIVTVIVWGLGYILGGFFSPCIHLNQHLSWIKIFLYISLDFKNHFFFTYCWYIHWGFFLSEGWGESCRLVRFDLWTKAPVPLLEVSFSIRLFLLLSFVVTIRSLSYNLLSANPFLSGRALILLKSKDFFFCEKRIFH